MIHYKLSIILKLISYYSLFSLIYLSCNSDNEMQFYDNFLGKSIEEVVGKLKLRIDDFSIIQEPPGIIRGISKSTIDERIYIYIARDSFGVQFENQLETKDVLNKQVVGFAIKKNGDWYTVGQVIDYYHSNYKN